MKYKHDQVVYIRRVGEENHDGIQRVIIGTMTKWADNGKRKEKKLKQPGGKIVKDSVEVLEKTLGYIVQEIPDGGFEQGARVIDHDKKKDKDGNNSTNLNYGKVLLPLYDKEKSTWVRESEIVPIG